MIMQHKTASIESVTKNKKKSHFKRQETEKNITIIILIVIVKNILEYVLCVFQVAKILEGFVKRKVIKQTVMTTVYGVTRYGAKLQIARQLKDIDEFPKEHVWIASSYLTGK